MQVVSGGDKTCHSQENSPGHRGESRRRRRTLDGRMRANPEPPPLLPHDSQNKLYYFHLHLVSLFDTIHYSQIICGLSISFFSIISRFFHAVFGRPDESTAERMDGDLDSARCVPLIVL